jgi:hypothetical protein
VATSRERGALGSALVMSSHRRLRVLLLPILAVLLVAGCGGGSKSNGIQKLSANAALAKVKAAAANVKSVHVKGAISQSGQSLTLELSVGTDAAQGKIGLGGGTMELRLVHGITYFRGDSKVFGAFGANATQSAQAANRWIKDTGTSGPASAFAAFLDTKKLFGQLLTPQGSLSTGGNATINGQKALILVDSSAQGGKLYVAETGSALPLRIERTGSNGGRIDFTDYNAAVKVDIPAGAVDISQLGG